MGISKPLVLEIAHRTYAINEFGMAAAFMLIGEERGLLIDTGCGMYNLRLIADELCSLPYDVAITHGHGDHIGSMDRWDKVWLHPADWDDLSMEHFEENKNRLEHYPDGMAAFGSFDAYDITRDQVRYPESVPEFLPLEDGQVFDLGKRKVEVIHTPGHTLGEVVFLDHATRILFSGDACNINLGIMTTSINTALKGLLKVKARESEFDRNWNGHIGYGSDTFNHSMPPEVLDECLAIMRSIIAGTADVHVAPTNPNFKIPPRSYVTYGHTRISFDPARVIDEGEEPAE